MIRIKLCIVALMVSISGSALADEADVVRQRFKDYWRVHSLGQFYAAAEYISPADLRQSKNEFLPIFLDAAQSTDRNVREQADIYFGDIPTQRRLVISDKESFIGLNRVGFAPTPQLLEKLSLSVITVGDVKFSSASQATIFYSVKFLNGSQSSGAAKFTKVDGLWYHRLNGLSTSAMKTRNALFPPNQTPKEKPH